MSEDWSGQVEDAVSTQQEKRDKRLLEMCSLFRAHPEVLMTVAMIKEYLAAEDGDWDACSLWETLDQQEQLTLWIAPTHGGLFTTDERKRLKPTTVTPREEVL